MLGTPTVKEALLEGRTRDLAKILDDGHIHYGSQTFNQSLRGLVGEGLIEFDDALAGPLRDEQLLRSVAQIEKLIGAPS